MEPLTVAVSQHGQRAVVAIGGELDTGSVDQVRGIDVAELAESGCRDLVVDLGEVEFMDSSGIGSLVSLRNRALAVGVAMTIDNAPIHVGRTLTVAGLGPMFGL